MAVQVAPAPIDVTVNGIWNTTQRWTQFEVNSLYWIFFTYFSSSLAPKKDIQFKLHSKYQLFDTNLVPTQSNGLDLLATASAFGLIITGHPSSPELQSASLNPLHSMNDFKWFKSTQSIQFQQLSGWTMPLTKRMDRMCPDVSSNCPVHHKCLVWAVIIQCSQWHTLWMVRLSLIFMPFNLSYRM